MTVIIRMCKTCRSTPSGEFLNCDECRQRDRDRVARYKASQRGRQRQAEWARSSAGRESARRRSGSWRARNRDAVKSVRTSVEGRAYARLASQRYRARKRGATVLAVSADSLRQRLEMFGEKCWMCGAPWVAWDHVKPLGKGGAHMLSNLRPACTSCNAGKGARWPWPIKLGRSAKSLP